MDENTAPSFKPWNNQSYITLTSDYMNTTIQFWSIVLIPSEIKSEPESEFESIGSKKGYFYILEEDLIFQRKTVIFSNWKLRNPRVSQKCYCPLKLNIWYQPQQIPRLSTKKIIRKKFQNFLCTFSAASRRPKFLETLNYPSNFLGHPRVLKKKFS